MDIKRKGQEKREENEKLEMTTVSRLGFDVVRACCLNGRHFYSREVVSKRNVNRKQVRSKVCMFLH